MNVIEVFKDTHMGLGHVGLYELAKAKGTDLKNLKEGSLVLFVNRARTAMKLYAPNHVLSYQRRTDSKRPFSLDAIQAFPQAFYKDGRVDYSTVIQKQLERILDAKAGTPLEKLMSTVKPKGGVKHTKTGRRAN